MIPRDSLNIGDIININFGEKVYQDKVTRIDDRGLSTNTAYLIFTKDFPFGVSCTNCFILI